jgi:E3 ubiquitin-protein ligase SHPRH
VTGKLMRSFTELRQQCCHPQIVRRDMWLGKTRLSMRQILTRLVLRAFGEYDIALRQEYLARLLLAAVISHLDGDCELIKAALALYISPISLCCMGRPLWMMTMFSKLWIWCSFCPRIVLRPRG